MASSFDYYTHANEKITGGINAAVAELRDGRPVHIVIRVSGGVLVAGTARDPDTQRWVIIHKIPERLTGFQARAASDLLGHAYRLVAAATRQPDVTP